MTSNIAGLQTHVDQQVALAHYLCRCGGTDPDGQPYPSWMRISVGYRRRGDDWRVIHKHLLAPFDTDDRALLGLQS